MEHNKFVICRQSRGVAAGFDYLEEFVSDGRFFFTEARLHACVIPSAMVSTALLWCELWDPGAFFFAMMLEG